MASKAVPHQAEPTRDLERGGWWDESASPAGYTGGHPPPRVDYQQQQQQHYHNATNYRAVDDNRRSDVGFWDRVAMIILAILLPPLGVFFQTGCNKDLAINVLLTLLGYVCMKWL